MNETQAYLERRKQLLLNSFLCGLMALGLLGVMVLFSGCTKNPVHAGAVDHFDSTTYDTLTTFQAVLDESKAQYALGKIPPSGKTVINDAGASYNALRTAWTGYRAFKQAGKDPSGYEAQINAVMPSVNQFIADLKLLIGGHQ